MNRNISLRNGELVTILTKGNKRKFLSLRWILLGSYILIGLVPLFFLTSTMFRTVNSYFVEERKKELLSQANVISGQLISSDYFHNEEAWEEMQTTMLEQSQASNFRVLVLDSSCVVIYDTSYSDVGKTYLLDEVLKALSGNGVANEQPNGSIYAAVSVVNSASQVEGVVLISALVTDVENTVGDIEGQAFLVIGIILVAVIFLMIAMAHTFTEPIKNIINVIKKMSEGHLEQRVPIQNGVYNEIMDLALACNNMADKLEQVESTRQQFVSNVSHELKTPLSSIKVLSESILLQQDVPKEMYEEFLRDINSEVDRMTEIINDLLTLVKLDQKEIPLNFAETNLNRLLEGIYKRLLPLAQVKQIELIFEAPKEVLAEADEMKLTLAISNLVDNAIKYTPEGGKVTFLLDADHQNAFITVTDNGIGIPEDEVGKIFDRFYRVDKTRDRETGGTGLGLSITHSTVMMHNGSIKVNSKENEGTSILVRIPLHQSQ